MSWKPIDEYTEYRFREDKYNQSERRLFDEWAKGKEIVSWNYGPNERTDLAACLRTGIRRCGKSLHALPPKIDHAVFFKSRSGKCWLTYQPYINAEELRPEVSGWAERNGFRAVVLDADRSWYYPGATCLVVVDVNEA